MKYAWIGAHRDQYKVNRMCCQLEVSRTGYDEWIKRPPSNLSLANAVLDAQVAATHLSGGQTRLVELHWYEAHGVGRRDFKIKRYLDRK